MEIKISRNYNKIALPIQGHCGCVSIHVCPRRADKVFLIEEVGLCDARRINEVQKANLDILLVERHSHLRQGQTEVTQ